MGKGRPPGSRNKVNLAMENLLEGEGEVLTRKVIEMALAGDIAALRLCMDHLLPPLKDRQIHLDIPPIKSPRHALEVMGTIVTATLKGEITSSEGSSAANIVGDYIETIEQTELLERIERIEKMMKGK